MNHLWKTILLAPLGLTCGCSNLCGDASQLSDASNGTFTYVESNAPKPGKTSTSGNLAMGLELRASQNATFSIEGSFTDAQGQSHAFTLALTGVSGGTTAPLSAESQLWFADCSPGDSDGSCVYEDQNTFPLTGSITTETFSTDCHAAEGCALTIVGTLHATASWGDASFVTDVDLDHHEVWETFACSTNNNDSS